MNILFLSDMTVSSVIRQGMPAEILQNKYKHNVQLANVFNLVDDYLKGFDIFSFIRPTSGTDKVMDHIKQNINPNAFFVVDQDDCFDAIPKHHVAYKYLGKGNPLQENATKQAMMRADVVTVSTPQLFEYYRQFNPKVFPNGWSKNNPLWKAFTPHEGIVIGWAGTVTHREDFKLVLDPIISLAREFPQVKIIINNDMEIFDKFRSIPWGRKMFIGMLPYDSYPGLIRNFDIMVSPLTSESFNRYKSDIKLVEAGAACIPFVASPTENYLAWGVGGLFASTSQEYYKALKRLILEPETRAALAHTGSIKAKTREMSTLVDSTWMDIIKEATLHVHQVV